MDLNLKNITFIIACFRSEKVIYKCIDSLPKNSKKIIIENSKNINLKNDLELKYDNIEVILNENLGMGASNNIGIKKSNTQFVYILNPDVTFENDTFSKLIEETKNIEDFSIISPCHADKNFPNFKNQKIITENISEVDSLDGFSMILNKDKFNNIGLTDFGIKVVQTCNDNSVIIDVSHIGEKSFWDIASASTKPFIASHSSVYKLCPHFRNLKDEQILEIKKSKGLIGLNPYPFFIDPDFKKKETDFIKKFSKEINQVVKTESNINKKWLLKQHYLQNKLQEIAPSLEIFIDH